MIMDDRAHDPYRHVVAAHELGHAITWRAAGFDIDEIWVKGRGAAAHGHVWIVQTEDQIRTVADERAVQAGLLAGRVAQHRWCDHANTAIDISCEIDEQYYRARRRSPLGRRVSRTAARNDARRLVRAHWRAIACLTPVLASAGRLSPSRLPL
jgi:hypothetical protein